MLGHQPAQVDGDLLDPRVDPVQDERHLGAAPRSGREQVPRDGVGVAGRGGDEQPQVRRAEELRGEVAVRLLHGVDVRGVQQGEALRQAAARHEPQRAGGPGGRRLGVRLDPGEAGQDAVAREPARVERMVHQHG